MPRMNAWFEPLGWMLIHSVWLITVIVVLTALALIALRRRSANAWYLVGCVSLLLSLGTLPAVLAWVIAHPAEAVDVQVVREQLRTISGGDALTLDESGEQIGVDVGPERIGEPIPLRLRELRVDGQPSVVDVDVMRPDESPVSAAVDQPTFWQRVESRLRPHLAVVVVLWLVGVVLLSTQPLIGWHSASRLQRVGLSDVSDSVKELLDQLAERIVLRRAIKIFQSSLVQIPCVVGAFKPVILLPASALIGLSADQLEALLAHELAHIRRHDFAVNVVQTLVETLLFYHPAIWWLSRRVRQEREHCCDNLAISICGDVAGYARMLVSIENLRGRVPQASVAASGGSLLERVRRLLPTEPRQVHAPWLSALIVLVTLAVLIGSWQWTVGQVENLPHETFVGTVEKPDGSLAAGATVIAVRYMPYATRESRLVATANERGEFTLPLSGFAGADASWIVSAVLEDDGGRLDWSISVPEEKLIHAPVSPRPFTRNRVIRLKPGRKVSGTVLDAATRKPIADAKVYAEDGRVVATDARGRFTLRGLPADVVGFIVTSPGLVRTHWDVDVSERAAADLEIALARGGTIRGRVLDPEGQPIANAGVTGETNNSILSAAVTEITDADGRFTFDGFPVNKLIYPLIVSAVGLSTDDGNALILRGPGDIQKITLRPQKSEDGSILRSFISLGLTQDHQSRVGTIRGRVVLRGQPVRNFTVRLVSPAQDEPEDGKDFSLSTRHFTAEDGRFVIGRLDADQRYRVAVTAEDESFAIVEPIYARAAAALTDKDEVEFPLKPAHQLRVRILDADTQQPIPNAWVGFKAEYPRREGFDWDSPPSGSRIEWTAADGVATFGNLAGESGPIFVEHPGFARQQIYWTRPQNSDGSSKPPDAEQLMLSLRKEARLSIRVSGLDGREFKYIFANVKPATNESLTSYGWDAQEPGTLDMRMLPPGRHSVTIHDNATNNPWTPLLTHEIELKPGDNELEIELPPAPKKTGATDDANENSDQSAVRPSPNPLVTVLQPAGGDARLEVAGEPMPAGMVQRLGGTRFKVPGWWRQLAFAGNDEWVWVKSDERVDVLHRASGRVVRHSQLRLGDTSVRSIAVSADGTRVAMAMFSPDGRLAVIVGTRGSFLWNHADDVEPIALAQKRNEAAQFAPDGKLLATANSDGVRLWDSATGELVTHLNGEKTTSPDGGIAFTPDSRFLAVPMTESNVIELWDVTAKTRVAALPCHQARAAAISRDGKWLAASGGDSVISVFDLKTRQLVSQPSEVHLDPPLRIVFTGDGDLLSASYDNARVWNVSTGKQRRVLAHETKTTIRGLAISPDKCTIVTSGFDDTLGVWERSTGKRLFTLKGHGRVGGSRDVRFTADGSRFASWGDDGHVRVWETKSGQQIAEHDLRPPGFQMANDGIVSDAMCATFSHDATTLLARFQGELIEFDTLTGKERRRDALGIESQPLAISPDGKWLAAVVSQQAENGDFTGTELVLIDRSTLQISRRWPVVDPDAPTTSPDARESAPAKQRIVPRVGGMDGAIAFSPDSKRLAWIQYTGRLLILVKELATDQLVARIPVEPSTWCLEFTPDCQQLATGQYDTTVSLWDLGFEGFHVGMDRIPRAKREQLSIVGLIDVDHDGKSDRTQLRELIEKTNTFIDNEVDDDGQRLPKDGRITAETKFLVVADIPDPTKLTDPDQMRAAERIQQHYAAMRKEAIAQGVRIVRLDSFFQWGSVRRRTDQTAFGVKTQSGNRPIKIQSSPSADDTADAKQLAEKAPTSNTAVPRGLNIERTGSSAEYRFTGTVVDARDDVVAGALVLYPVSFDQATRKWRTAKAQANERGEFVLSVPKAWFRIDGFPLTVVWAWAKDHACDTVNLGDPEKDPGPIRLTLLDRQPSEFTVHDEHDKPVAGATVVAEVMDVPNGSDLVGGLYGMSDWVPEELRIATAQVTDERGRVVMDLAARERLDTLQVTSTTHAQQRSRQQENECDCVPWLASKDD